MLAFVYGTLTDPDRVDAVVDEWRFEGPATLVGLRRAEGRYPTLVPAEESEDAHGVRVEGRLLRTPDVAALDGYEGVDRGLYVRVAVPVEGRSADARAEAEAEAALYVGDPGRLGVDAVWPGEGSLAGRVRRYVDEHGVRVARG